MPLLKFISSVARITIVCIPESLQLQFPEIKNDIITNSKQQTKAQGQYLLLVKVLKHSLDLREATGDDESLNLYTIFVHREYM